MAAARQQEFARNGGTQSSPSQDLLDQVLEQTERLSAESQDALESFYRAEVDIQVATAKKFPRNLTRFRHRALEMATLDEETAASCFYSLPRSGKTITGPSIRLAEICSSAWGNLRISTRIVHEGERFITAQGSCHDLETNIATTADVRRRITDKAGRRYNDDMLSVTGNAACSIARRNAILSVIPMAFIKEIERAARQTAVGDAKTLVDRRATLVDYFQKMGVTPDRVCAAVEKGGIEDIGLEELSVLRGMATAIKDGVISVDDAFPAGTNVADKLKAKKQAADQKTAELETKLAEKQAEKPAPPAPATAAPAAPEDAETREWVENFDERLSVAVFAASRAEIKKVSDYLIDNRKQVPGYVYEACGKKVSAAYKALDGSS